jgi:hypothetical protein
MSSCCYRKKNCYFTILGLGLTTIQTWEQQFTNIYVSHVAPLGMHTEGVKVVEGETWCTYGRGDNVLPRSLLLGFQ